MKKISKKVSVDIRDIRFVPVISTTTKVFVDKKRKQSSRKYLNAKLKKETD